MFDDRSWTDKTSPLWFIMLPTGHEGPYSLGELEERMAEGKLAPHTPIWREGLPVPLSLGDVLKEIEFPEEFDDDLPPPLPPLPDEDELPEIPLTEDLPVSRRERRNRAPFILGILLLGLLGFGGHQWLKDREVISIRRYPKMTLELHKRIGNELRFEGFDKKLFFREYVSPDLTHIWLVTSGFQTCTVEANFRSMKDRLLTMGEEEVEFISRGKLSDHVVELSSFEFSQGSRIIPGLYEMKLKATDCVWEGLAPRIRNLFSAPEKSHEITTRVVLYPQGSEVFQEVLSQLLKKKEEIRKAAEGQETLFWEDLQMKLQTLHAISLQIEQHFLDFLDKGGKNFPSRLKTMVTDYTRKFGKALTEFVVSNEAYFDGLRESDLRALITAKDYEGLVRSSSKEVGLESMKIIERLQGMKAPKEDVLRRERAQVAKVFQGLKDRLTTKLLGVTEDRSKGR